MNQTPLGVPNPSEVLVIDVQNGGTPSPQHCPPHSRWRRKRAPPPILGADSGSGGSGSWQGHAERTGSNHGGWSGGGGAAAVAGGGRWRPDSAELATELGVEHQSVVGAAKSLQAGSGELWASDTGLPRFCICNSFARRALPPRQILLSPG